MLTSTLTSLRLGCRHPVVPRALIVAFVVGALGGTVPTGFLAFVTGAGIGRGATWGMWAFAVSSPIVVVYTTSTLCAARFDWHVDTDLFLSGQPYAATIVRDGVTATWVALLMAMAAAAGGAIVGAADAAARGTTLWTGFSLDALLAGLGASWWWTVIMVLLVGIVLSAATSYLIVVGFFVASVAAVQVADAQSAWNVLSASPLGAFTLVAGEVVAGRRGLVTHTILSGLACVIWPAALGWLVWRLQRHRVPRTPSGAVRGD